MALVGSQEILGTLGPTS